MKKKKLENKESELIELFQNILNEKINLNSNQTNSKNWDSMAYLSILSSLEKKYKVKINQRNFSKFNSIKSILKILK